MKRICALFLLLALLLGGCAKRETYEIVATTAPVWQFSEAVCAGTGLEVGLVVQDSVSCLHDYTLSVRQMAEIERAKVVILSGANLETFLSDALEGKSTRIECSDGIDLLPSDDGGWDPHVWLAPKNAETMTRNIAEGLAALYPDRADRFRANAEAYCARLEALQTACEAELAALSCRDLVTFHDGFAYFAQAFQLNILAAVEEESGSEASAKELRDMISLVRENGLPAIFVEKNGSRAAASVISRETGCAVGVLDTAMSGTDYFTAIQNNVDAIREAMS